MGSRVKRSELWSLLVFVVGITIGIAGTTLAIIFGVQNSKPCSCDKVNAELFSSQVGIQKGYMSWNDDFNNSSSPQYLFAVQNLSAALTSALTSGNTNRRMFAALPSGTSGSVQVAQLRKGEDGSIICFAYGTVYGNVDASALPSYSTIQSQIDSTTSLATGATVDTVSSPANSPCNDTYGSTTAATKTSATTTSPAITVSTPKNRLTTQITTSTQKVATSLTPSTNPATSTVTTMPSSIPSTVTIETSVITQKTTPELTTPLTGPTQTASPTPSGSTSSSTSASFSPSPTGNSTSTSDGTVSTAQANMSSTLVSPTTSRVSTNTSSTPKPSSTMSLASSPSPSTAISTIIGSLTTDTTGTATPGIPSTSLTDKSSSTTNGVRSTVNTAITTTVTSILSSTISLSTKVTRTSVPSASTSTASAPILSASTSTVPVPTSTVPTSATAIESSSTSQPTSTMEATIVSTNQSSPSPTTSTILPSTTMETTVVSTTQSSPSPTTSTTLPSTTMETTVVSTTQSSPTPTTSTTLPSTTTMTTSTVTPCTGVKKHNGDIAVAFELTTNTNHTAIEHFVTTLLNYTNNPYSFSPDAITSTIPTAYMLAPYPETATYYPAPYGQGIDSISNLLDVFNIFLKANEQNAKMLDALEFINTTQNLHPMQRTIVLVGVSDLFVNDALKSASNMAEQGFEIFTVNMGMEDLSRLATDSDHAYIVNTDSDEVKVATSIGNRLLNRSSICFHAQKPTTTTAQPKSTSTYSPLPTTSSCNAVINQDIAFVVEISTSTGNLNASKVAANFITNYLLDNSLHSTHFDDEHSHYAIVPFPYPKTYVGFAPMDFLSLQKNGTNTTFSTLLALFPFYNNGNISDIESGLSYAQDIEFPLVSTDSLPHTVLLFANSAEGVSAANKVATDLKNNKKNILTVAVGDKDFDLKPLASDQEYYWNLPVSSDESYTQLAEKIISQLLKIGKVCR